MKNTESEEKPKFDTAEPTRLFMKWLRDQAGNNSGELPAFSNAEAGIVMGLPDSHTRHRGQVQSRIDFACYRCSLPPLGLAADERYKNSWSPEGTGWSYPVEQMAHATKQRRWYEHDFNRLEAVLAELKPGATKLWKDEIASNLAGIKQWSFSLVRDDFIPVKQPKEKNPAWSRDELILALNLYMQHRASPPKKGSVEVAELSRLLRKMGNRLTKGETFRNTNGVYMKLMNFRSIDPNYTSQNKVGLQGLGKDDQNVWNLYFDDLQALKMAADAITAAVLAPISETGIDQPDEHDHSNLRKDI